METNMLVLMSIIFAIGLLGVVAVEIISIIQEAEAKGCRTPTAGNASKGKMFAGLIIH
jgi:hypothetical protein